MRALLPLLFVALGACRETRTQPSIVPEPARGTDPTPSRPSIEGPHVVIRPAGRDPITVRVELARTEDERNRGLMYRRELAPNAGMLFLFASPSQQTFWMRNTFLPLDMVFIKSDRRVLGVVANATPMTDDPRQVDGDSQYVLEVNAGFAARNGIAAGTQIEFYNVPPATM